ncbi:60S ribosomal export protein NMD3-like [Tropilaelaps mercedesae]|uniref:60S ribosomal export protein NMD3 n=1 Tax=Tropilaelaps mercedesae TaxID=418985 RepID=A0A1V9XQX0_9ACAR|nr:60S ribosomal export protein NMD3-like [Tropilaelaps mercedesae]
MNYMGDSGPLVGPPQGISRILCCECGIDIEPNPANMCLDCLRLHVNITDDIPKQGVLQFCKGCERYLMPPSQWVVAALESSALLAICLKKIKGLDKVRLIDAGFIWTEPHSKRIKVKLTIQKEVLGGAIVEQVFVVEFTVSGLMCNACHRREAKDFWRAVVQCRQKVEHKKTLLYMEQLILKYNAHKDTLNIKAVNEGIDFYFAKKDEARKLVQFFQSMVPMKVIESQQLVSHDIHSNTANYKTTFSVEIVPVCKGDVVCLPPALARQLGSMNQICVCLRVTSSIHVIDPATLQFAEIPQHLFWKMSFRGLFAPKQLLEYVVMSIERVHKDEMPSFAGQGKVSERHVLANVFVIRSSELGMHENYIHCKTHLGHYLREGDLVLGFDMRNANLNDLHFNRITPDKVPEVVLIKKFWGTKADRAQRRRWRLRRLNSELIDGSSMGRDFNDFCEDLEEDAAFRQNVNIYRDSQKTAAVESGGDKDLPQISLEEMLDDLTLEDAPMEEEAENDQEMAC